VTDSLTDRRVVRALLAEAGVRPSKRLGQNFLVDPGVLEDIEEVIGRAAPATIVEIGPGLGAVTEVLIRLAPKVVAVEVDRRLAELLTNRLVGKENLEVLNEDVLRLDLKDHVGEGPVYVAGSLPYRITAPILKWLIDQRQAITGALLITQTEVAEKIAASPGKDGTALGLLIRAYADVESVRRVARGCFVPVPAVDSTLWSLAFRARPRFESNPEAFFAVVRALYGTRRKMIRGALRALVPADSVGGVLDEAEIDGTARGEELGFEQLDRLAASVSPHLNAS
jgi:16S rRNA (adenine1518-N6/adenine1519-N6)-dimethyltransferase